MLPGSVLPDPSSCTVAPVVTDWLEPAFATGAAGRLTVMFTVEGLLLCDPSVTTSWKVSVVAVDGAVKVGLTAVESDSVTAGPAVCVHL